jgi:hypothetical protein
VKAIESVDVEGPVVTAAGLRSEGGEEGTEPIQLLARQLV